MKDNKLNEFRDIINGVSDVSTLESGYNLLHDMIKISSMRKEIDKLEEGLVEGGRAMFYYFAMSLDEEEYPYVAEKIKGKISRLTVKKNREESSKEEDSGEEEG